jgi:uncharacterized protein YerC
MSKPKIGAKIEIPDEILKNLLTASELRMLKNRWQIIQMLEAGDTIRNVADKVKVGTDTVVRVSKMMQDGNLQKVLDSKVRNVKKIKTSTPWIFGKNE